MKSVLARLCTGLAFWLAGGVTLLVAQNARDRAVELTAVAQETPPTITLQWNATGYPLVSQKIYRRLKGGPAWVEIATPANAATSYADTAVVVGVNYEYRVARTYSGGPGFAEGYLSSGIRVPFVAERGRAILLVDGTMSAPLATELARFQSDLTGDGWGVARQDVSRTAAVTSIRAAIQAFYSADPANTVALILFGHIPVPYSGDFAIDGHGDHFGAWPTDVYYGDIDGTWTDEIVNDPGAGQLRNRNTPGDGKFDQTIIPSDIELEVGRIDLANLPAFTVSETELLRRYLDRDHNYRHRLGAYASIGQRALVDDSFGYFGGEAFAVTAWRSFTACVGAGNVQALDWFGTLATQSYLWAYGCGAGTFTSAGGVGATSDFASTPSLAVFNVSFGSYFGDWDYPDSFLRAPLAGTASSLGLVSCWAGRPHWVFHHLALGETVGYAARLTQNNSNASGQGYDSNVGERFNHLALLGDPTLRLYPVTPPSSLTATPAAQAVALNWSAPADGPIAGYLISRATSPTGPFVRLRSALSAGTSFVDRTATPGASYTYLVRAVKDETSPSGTFSNPSQGIYSATVNAGAASGPEIDLRGNGNPISADDTAAMAGNGTDFGPVEVSAALTRSFTITNLGPAPLAIGGPALSGGSAADFTVVNFPPSTIATGESANFQIQFHPTSMGPRAATVTITSNDPDEANYQFAIAGTGTPAHAEIAIYPPAINRSIHAGDAVTETLSISNPGPGALVHTITSSLARYSARDSDSFASPAYAWVDIATTGTAITGWANNDDAISAPLSLGFSFPFYGSTFNTVRVSTNGFLSFTDTNISPGNSALPNPSAAANLIALLWADLLLDAGSHVYWQTVGGNFVVQFDNVSLYGNSSVRLTCEAILKPGGEILLQYKTLTNLGSNYTIGLQNSTRDDGLLISYNALYAHAGLAIRVRPPGFESWLSLSGNAGTIAPGGAQQIAATLNASTLTAGEYYAELTVNSNALGHATLTVPVRLTVGNTPVENWRLAHFGTTADSGAAADSADGDHDTRNNLLEYALGTDPLTAEPGGPLAVATNAAGYLQIQFNRDATHTDLRYVVEAAPTPAAGWTPIASSIHGAPMLANGAHSAAEVGAGDVKSVTVEDTAPAASFARRYLRLRVVRD
jgi:hypothetical protein